MMDGSTWCTPANCACECAAGNGLGALEYACVRAVDGCEKKPLSYELKGFIYPGTGLSSRAVSHQVLSLLTVFTFVFGMGTGVFRTHQHQEPFRLRILV